MPVTRRCRLPRQTVARYLAALADQALATSTINRRAAAIRYAHKAAGHEPPTNSEAVKATMRGIRRTLRRAPVRKAPAVAAAIGAMLEQLAGDRLQVLRDRALLLIAFAAALRRSELVDLKVNDVERHAGGIVLQIRAPRPTRRAAARRSRYRTASGSSRCGARRLARGRGHHRRARCSGRSTATATSAPTR
jgi:site-specific recombinase XerD